MAANFVGVGLMSLWALAAIGLWFQSRIAAFALLSFAIFGIIYALVSIGKIRPLSIATRLSLAVWSIQLLVEYLKGELAK
jgi:hypothetical protein